MRGFKGFNKDLKCRGFQYEVGKEFEQEGKPEVCDNGFHFCQYPLDVFNYYAPNDSRYCDVESTGDVDEGEGEDSKVATSKISIGAEIGIKGIIEGAVKFIFEKVDWKNAKESNTGDQSAATNTGDQSAATNTGDQSAATNTGTRSAATNTGDQSAATNTGTRSAATNTGYQSAATNTGDQSAATNTGTQSAATNTGTQSAATNTGTQSAATNTGYQSAASVEGKESIACALGVESKAKGALGCWIVVSEWYKDKDWNWHIKSVKSAKVDGETIKADTWYILKDDNFIEVE